jgi:DNA invertase Pin-like site-specific DNA recombinase
MALRNRSDQKGCPQPALQSLENQSRFSAFWLIKKDFLSDRGAMVAPKRVAIYARVSTLDKGQDPETQLLALRAYAARRGFVPTSEYVDYASGRRDDRPQYQALLGAARKRHIDVVLVWRYDRFARSTQALVQALNEFHRLGVDFISYQENIDTTTPQGEMSFTVLAALAQFESALMSDRVKAGMARARAHGKRLSRAPIPCGVQARSADLYRQEVSMHQISQQLGIGYGTAWNYVQRVKAGRLNSDMGHLSP